MSIGVELREDVDRASLPPPGTLGRAIRTLAAINDKLIMLSMIALMLAGGILSLGVLLRYFLKIPTDWQDEASVFLLVGATFLSSAYVQSYRGHVGIEAFAHILPAGVNRVRLILVDLISTAFCAFFSWKSWTLFHEAIVDHQTTTSTFSPPLAIPYDCMSFGMTLLTVQIALQLVTRSSGEGKKP
jgi:TRAP-type C4-dicarboxylate transport system permease small subunit